MKLRTLEDAITDASLNELERAIAWLERASGNELPHDLAEELAERLRARLVVDFVKSAANQTHDTSTQTI